VREEIASRHTLELVGNGLRRSGCRCGRRDGGDGGGRGDDAGALVDVEGVVATAEGWTSLLRKTESQKRTIEGEEKVLTSLQLISHRPGIEREASGAVLEPCASRRDGRKKVSRWKKEKNEQKRQTQPEGERRRGGARGDVSSGKKKRGQGERTFSTCKMRRKSQEVKDRVGVEDDDVPYSIPPHLKPASETAERHYEERRW
jgi:hypothetical protein